MSDYENKLERLDKLKKATELARKLEVVKILERYTGKIKDLQAFEEYLKKNSDFICQGLKGKETTPVAPVATDKIADNQLLVGKIVEEIACKITDINAWRDYISQYQGFIRKTQTQK